MSRIESKENIANTLIQPSKFLARRLKRDLILLGTGLGLTALIVTCGSTPTVTPLVKVATATATATSTSTPTEVPITATVIPIPSVTPTREFSYPPFPDRVHYRPDSTPTPLPARDSQPD